VATHPRGRFSSGLATQPRDHSLRTVIVATIAVLTLPSAVGAADFEPRRSGVVEVLPPTLEPGSDVESRALDNVNVTQNGNPQNETSIAADPQNPMNLLGGTNDYRFGDSDAGVAYSFDGGATWTASTLDGIDSSFGKYTTQGDPALAAYIDFNRDDDQNRLAVATSWDGGVTWPQLGVIVDHTGGGSHDFEDKEYIAVDNTGGRFDGNIYVSWSRFFASGDSRIFFSRSIDGGATFSTPMPISDGTGVQGSVPAVGPSGHVYVVWMQENSLRLDKSTDGGVTWGSDVFVSSIDHLPSPLPGADFRVNSFPTIAVDRPFGSLQDLVYVAWADESVGGQGPDVLFRRSVDGGRTWSPSIRVSDDTNESFQWFPWMSVDPDGSIDVVFSDRRENPNSPRYHTYLARSTDYGVSFGANTRLSDTVSDATYDGFGGLFIGDYNGLVSTSLGARPFWTDTRPSNGDAEGYTDLDDIVGVGDDGAASDPLALLAGPNPFATRTSIRFELADAGPARITLFNTAGRRVWELSRPAWSAGPHAVTWGGRDDAGAELPSGIYVYRIEAGSVRAERKLALIR
jgi:hypothetical protein